MTTLITHDAAAPQTAVHAFTVRALLLGFEGTLSARSHRARVLLPYATTHLPRYVERHAEESAVRQALAYAAVMARTPDVDPVDTLLAWLAEGRTAPPLKKLQTLVWSEGYASGDLRGHIFADALRALRQWRAAGLPRIVYSSGSVQAQMQHIRHSEAGDLCALFDRHFDTAVGTKADAASYARIAATVAIEPAGLLFLSDNPLELSAARAAGLQVVQVLREGNVADGRFVAIRDFGEIAVVKDGAVVGARLAAEHRS